VEFQGLYYAMILPVVQLRLCVFYKLLPAAKPAARLHYTTAHAANGQPVNAAVNALLLVRGGEKSECGMLQGHQQSSQPL
jgi:hypothetical protein